MSSTPRRFSPGSKASGRVAGLLALALTPMSIPVAAVHGLAVSGLAAQKSLERHFDDSKFEPLFDGSSLGGWVTAGGRYDGKAAWTVEDGAITGREGPGKAGGLIYTERKYANFIFTCDCYISYPFDSGVFVRMVPRSEGGKGGQFTLDYREGGEIGGIYADGYLQHNEEGKAKWRRDQWNHVEVRCVGRDFRLEFWLNGEKLTDYQLPEGSEGYAPRGRIGLQVHGARGDESIVQFKNIRLRELPEFDTKMFHCDVRGQLSLTEAGEAAGWRSLWNGKDLSGWRPVGAKAEGFRAVDGVLEFPHAGGGGYLRTEAKYRDFELRMDFKIARGANSGLFLRAADQGNPAFSGCEVQILDDQHWEQDTKGKLKDWQFTGSLYGSKAPERKGALHPNDVWNTYQIRYSGSQLRVGLNGQQLYDVDTHQLPLFNKQSKPFAERASEGFIGLQRHAPARRDDAAAEAAFAAFRNVFIRPMKGEGK